MKKMKLQMITNDFLQQKRQLKGKRKEKKSLKKPDFIAPIKNSSEDSSNSI